MKAIIAHANLRNAISVYSRRAGFCPSINTVIYNMITAVSTNIFTSGGEDPEMTFPECFGFIQALLKENKRTPQSSEQQILSLDMLCISQRKCHDRVQMALLCAKHLLGDAFGGMESVIV